ncbi:MAG: YnfA family protein [Nitrososphaeraceae archaeon]
MAETVIITNNLALSVFTSIILFFVAALAEIGGGYLVWKWIRERKGIMFGLFGGTVLFIYGIIPTLQPSNFGRVYAAYGGIFIISAVIWGMLVDKKKPDRYEIIGSLTAILGAIIIFYAPR